MAVCAAVSSLQLRVALSCVCPLRQCSSPGFHLWDGTAAPAQTWAAQGRSEEHSCGHCSLEWDHAGNRVYSSLVLGEVMLGV